MKKLILVVLAFTMLGIVPAFGQLTGANPVSQTLAFTLHKNESLSMTAVWAGGNAFTMTDVGTDSDALGINITGKWNLAPSRKTVDYCFNLTTPPSNGDAVSIPAANFYGGTTATPANQLSTSGTDCGTTGATRVAGVTLDSGTRQNNAGSTTSTWLQVRGATTQAGDYTGGVLTIYAWAN